MSLHWSNSVSRLGFYFFTFSAPSAKVVFSGMESYVWKNAHNSNPLRVAFSIK